MPYDNVISRSDSAALVPEEVSAAMLKSLSDQSAVLTSFPHIPVSRNQTRFPVVAALPTAYFVNGDTGLKQTTEMSWDNKYLNIEELAAVVPIPEAVLDDTSYDVWGAVRPLLEQAIGRAIDAAVFFGTNKPASWPNAIVADASSVDIANKVARGTNTDGAEGGLAADISDLFALVEADGYDVSFAVANRSYRGKLRNLRDANGVLLTEVSPSQAYGVNIAYPMRGLWPSGTSKAEMFVGDAAEGIVAVRQDFTYKILDQAVIQDNTGAIQYNLAQQDMVALRIVFRVGFQIANTINYDQPDATKRYPFGVLLSPAS